MTHKCIKTTKNFQFSHENERISDTLFTFGELLIVTLSIEFSLTLQDEMGYDCVLYFQLLFIIEIDKSSNLDLF